LIVLQTMGLGKSFGIQRIFEQVSLTISDKEKVGLVGPNGVGKTTLLRCLTGEERPDEGEISLGEFVSIGYMEQVPDYPPEVTLFEAVLDSFSDILTMREKLSELERDMSQTQGKELEKKMAAYGRLTEEYERSGGFSCEAMIRRVISGLGFSEEDMSRKLSSFSGGEKTKVSVARLLVRRHDLLLLDEPTNHLDLQAVEWLEGFLKSYPGALLIISHDRYFLDQVTQRTLEFENNALESYAGNYSHYVHLKEEKIISQLKAYEKQQKAIEATEQYIDKYRAGIKSKQARGRQSQLNRLERIDKPQDHTDIHLGGDPYRVSDSANIVLKATDLAFSFSEKKLWEKVSFTLNRGEKVALIGPNGIGKTTLLNVIKEQVEPNEGKTVIGSRVNLGWFDQEHRDLVGTNQVMDEIMNNGEINLVEARNMLGSFLFCGDDVFKKVEDLSGGEKGRLSFLKLLIKKPNFLVLDEPTNHLDIASKGVIEEYLENYPGTILVVSHDRYFLDKITKRTLELTPHGIKDYLGNYSYYREKKEQLAKEAENQVSAKAVSKVVKVEKAKINKAQTRERIREIERMIEEMEARKDDLTNLLADGASYQVEDTAKRLLREYKELEESIPQYYSEWDELLTLLGD